MPEFLLHFYLYYCTAVQCVQYTVQWVTTCSTVQQRAVGRVSCQWRHYTHSVLSERQMLQIYSHESVPQWPPSDLWFPSPQSVSPLGGQGLIQSDDNSVWSDLCTWLWESGLKPMEVPWAGFFSNLGGNEQHNIRSDGTSGSGLTALSCLLGPCKVCVQTIQCAAHETVFMQLSDSVCSCK